VPLSIIELDVDTFNDVNDKHGHAAGDRILRELGARGAGAASGCDTCVRYAAGRVHRHRPRRRRQEVTRPAETHPEAIEGHDFAVHGGRPARLRSAWVGLVPRGRKVVRMPSSPSPTPDVRGQIIPAARGIRTIGLPALHRPALGCR